MRLFKFLFIPAFLILLVIYSFQCEEEDWPEITTTSPQPMALHAFPTGAELNVGDTLWLSGKVSAKVLHLTTKDSVGYDFGALYLEFLRLKTPVNNQDLNTTHAAFEFDYVASIGKVEKEWADPVRQNLLDNLQRLLIPELVDSNSYYQLKIGIIPKSIGYFAFKCLKTTFQVNDYHRELYAEFGDTNTNSYYILERGGPLRSYVDKKSYFIKVN